MNHTIDNTVVEENPALPMLIGAVIALFMAVGISNTYLNYATETYTVAIKKIGSPSIKAAEELVEIHQNEKEPFKRLLARSIMANHGEVYTWQSKWDPLCLFYGCDRIQSGRWHFYTRDFEKISYENGQVHIPGPPFVLWIYVLFTGWLIRWALRSDIVWFRRLAIGVIIGGPIALCWNPIPAYVTILFSGITGGGIAYLLQRLWYVWLAHSPDNTNPAQS